MKKFWEWSLRNPMFLALVWVILAIVTLGIAAWMEVQTSKRDNEFSYNCDLNKGIAVRDLDGTRRCLPSFSVVYEKVKGQSL